MSAPIAGPPPTEPVASGQISAPPVDNPPASPVTDDDWRLRLTNDDRELIVTLAAEHHARRRPRHRDARDLQHRIEGTSPHA